MRTADACGGSYQLSVAPAPRETAVGIWPELVRDEHGVMHLRLSYPKFTLSGEYLYGADFVVVRDATYRRFARAMARTGARQLEVGMEVVRPGTWLVGGWTRRA